MLFELFLSGIQKFYKDDLYLIALFIGMLLLFNSTFQRKFSLKKTIFRYFIVCLFLYFTFRGLYAIQYTIFYSYQNFFDNHQLLYDIFYNFGIWMFFIQVIYLFLGARWIYKGSKPIILFASATFYMFVSVVADYFMPLFLVLLCPRTGESGYYYYFQIGGGTFYPLIGVVISFILNLIYRRKIRDSIKVIMELSEKQMKKMTIIPILSCITYNIFYLVMSYVDVYPSAPEGLIYFIIIFATVIAVYLLMYVALFYGITSTIATSKVKAQLDIASEIQMSNMPKQSTDLQCYDQLEILADMEPALEVGGDFYDYYMIGDHHLAIVIADVSGKGIGAALFMMMSKALIRSYSYDNFEPGDIFMKVNKQLHEGNKSMMFLTAFMGILDLQSGVFKYTNAGHNYPMIKRANDVYKKFLIKNDFIIAGQSRIMYHTYETKLEENDEIFLYTDGVTEAINMDGDFFGEERLVHTLNSNSLIGKTIDFKFKYVQKALNEFKNQEKQSDDITMLLIRYKKRIAMSKSISVNEFI